MIPPDPELERIKTAIKCRWVFEFPGQACSSPDTDCQTLLDKLASALADLAESRELARRLDQDYNQLYLKVVALRAVLANQAKQRAELVAHCGCTDEDAYSYVHEFDQLLASTAAGCKPPAQPDEPGTQPT